MQTGIVCRCHYLGDNGRGCVCGKTSDSFGDIFLVVTGSGV
jgi:hypothetical protein